jgi:hypothetical protein
MKMKRTTSPLWAFLLSSWVAVSALAEVEVYLLAGQSNMHGLGPLKELPPEGRKTPARVFFWNGNTFVPMVPGKTTNLPLVYGQVLPYAPSSKERWFIARDEIRTQMQAADSRSGKPAAIPGAWMVHTDGVPLLKDHLHYSGVGQWRLGKAFAKAMMEAQRAAPGNTHQQETSE